MTQEESTHVLNHTATPRGKKVLVVLRDGTRIEDRFLDRGNGWILLAQYGKVKAEHVRCLTIWRA